MTPPGGRDPERAGGSPPPGPAPAGSRAEAPYADTGPGGYGRSDAGHQGYGQPPVYGGPPAYGRPPGYGPGPQGYGAPGGFGAGPPGYGSWQHVRPDLLMQAHRPGIIPLRPLGLGDMFDGAFRTLRRNPQATIGLAFLVSAAFMVPSLLVTAALGRTGWLAPEDMALLVSYIPALFGALSTVLLAGFIVYVVSEAALGQKVSIGQTWQHVKGRILHLIGASLLVGLILMSTLALLVGVFVLLGWNADGGLLAVVILLGLLVTVPLLIWMGVRLSMTTPALVLERVGVLASVKRSWQLTSGKQFWRILGITVLAALLVQILVSILMLPLTVAFGVATFAAGAGGGAGWVMILFSHGIQLLSAALTTPFLAGISCLLYLDQRIRREALDITLVQVAQQRAGRAET